MLAHSRPISFFSNKLQTVSQTCITAVSTYRVNLGQRAGLLEMF